MARRTKEAERAKRYRQRRQHGRQAVTVDAGAQVAAVRKLARADAPEHLLRAYVDLTTAFNEEMAGKRRSRSLKELNESVLSLARELGITPKERRLSGEGADMVPMADIAASLQNVMRVRRTRWEDLRMEIALFLRAGKEDLGGQHRAMFLKAVAGLRATAPDLFDPDELAATPEDLVDRIAANAAAYLPGPLT
jgi:hypothetical protein